MTQKYYFTSSSLTALAEAVREAAGTEEPLTMAEIKSAIAALPLLPGSWEMGSFTPEEDSEMQDVSITHSLGALPVLVLVFCEDGSFWQAEEGDRYWRCLARIGLTEDVSYCTSLYQSDVNVRARAVAEADATETDFTLPYMSGYKYRGGSEYVWLAIAPKSPSVK